MALVSRLGVTGFPRSPQTFTPKTANVSEVTIVEATRLAGGTNYVRWTSSSSGPFRVFVDGVLVDQTSLTEVWIHAGFNEARIIEILADPNAAPTPVKSSRFDLQWSQVTSAKEYKIEQFDGSSWVEIDRMMETREAFYVYRTPTLDDDTTHQFRVTPVGTNGNDGTALALAKKMVRNPDPPSVGYAFNAGPATVTITGV